MYICVRVSFSVGGSDITAIVSTEKVVAGLAALIGNG